MKLANVIAVIGLTALLVVTGLVLLEVLMRAGPVLALRDAYPGLDDRLRQWGMDGLSDLYAPLGIVAVAACLPAMLATRSAITVRFMSRESAWASASCSSNVESAIIGRIIRSRAGVLAPKSGIEPETYRLGGGRSIH